MSIPITAVINVGKRGPKGDPGEGSEETTATILEKLQGTEADAERIGAEYLPEQINASIITLADTSALMHPAGSLGLNADGNAVLHDGERNGSELPIILTDRNRKIFNAAVPAETLDDFNKVYVTDLATIDISSAESVNGNTLSFIGEIYLLWGAGSRASDGYGLCLYTDQNTLTTEPGFFVYLPAATNSDGNFERISLNLDLLLETSGVFLDISLLASRCVSQAFHGGSLVNSAPLFISPGDKPKILPNIGQELRFGWYQFSYTEVTVAPLRVKGNLEILR
jgi:hypothetical protein